MNTNNKIKSVLTLAFVAMAALTISANAGNATSELGIMDLEANGGINPNTGVAWEDGDQYRLAFHTLGKHDATSNDPGVYNAFVTAQAQLNPALLGSSWLAVVSVNLDSSKTEAESPKINAKENTGTDDLTGGAGIGGAGVPVYAMDGTTCIARNNADIWDNWSNPFDGDAVIRVTAPPASQNVHYSPFLDQYGNQTVTPDDVHGMDCMTGSNSNGTSRSPMGNTTDNTQANWGSSNANNPGRIYVRWDSGDLTGTWSFYAISEPLTVVIDPNRPIVDAGDDWVTWTGEKVKLDSTVTNNDPLEPTLTILWTYEILGDANNITVVLDPAINPGDPNTSEAVDPNVTITIDDPNVPRPVIVELTLTVTRPGSDPASDSVKIEVYDDNCAAAVGKGEVLDPGDFDADCDTDMIDLRQMIDAWLDEYALTEPAVKP
jgi:hypothetical protein